MRQIAAAIKIIRSEGAQAPLLITGQSEVQIEASLNSIIQIAICSSGANEFCGKCQACHLVALGTHPDVSILRGSNKTIAIKSVREFLAKATLKSHGRCKLLVIPKAELLSLPAASALLKSLEDGSDSTRFILTTRWKQRLIPTILSRCQQIALSAAPGKLVNYTGDTNKSFLSKSTLQRISHARDLTDEDIDGIVVELEKELKASGPSRELLVAYMRLRDYYRIKSERGNSQLAKEVLSASLPRRAEDEN